MTSPHVPPGTLFYPTPSLQIQRSAAYSNQTYSTLGLQGSAPMVSQPSFTGCATLPTSSSVTKTAFSPSDPNRKVDEIVIHEPDLNKRPTRSALKGAKSKELLQKQLQAKLLEKQRLNEAISQDSSSSMDHRVVRIGGITGQGDSPRAPPPKIAPKPRVFLPPRK
jgi:hypothetical protein